MDTSKSGWAPYVHCTRPYSTLHYTTSLHYTTFRRLYWARELLEKWGNQSKSVVQGKELNTGFSTEVQ